VALLASLGLPDLKTRKYLRAPRKIKKSLDSGIILIIIS